VWFFAWFAHAITHGINPFYSSAINAPSGVNLADNTFMPLLGLLASPVTWLRGPVAAYNLFMRLAFATSATSMFFVARRFTSRWFPAYLAGLVYGFSPYVVGEGHAHLFLAFVPLPPIIFLACFELCREHRRRTRNWGLILGVTATCQFFISPEVLVSTGMCCALGLLFAACVRPTTARRRVLPFLRGVGWSLTVFAPLVAYPFYFFLRGPGFITGPPQSVAALAPYRVDLFGPITPTIDERFAPAHLAAIGSAFAAGNVGENGIYLGIPLVCLLIVGVIYCRRELIVLTAAAVALCAFVLSLGTPLTIDGRPTGIGLPFGLVTRLPYSNGLLSARFSLYVQLSAAFVLAIAADRLLARPWARAGRAGRAAVGAVALAALIPLVPAFPYQSFDTAVPTYFTGGLDRAIPTGSIVLTYPYDYSPYNDGMLWQAVSGFRFRIIGGEATRRGPGGTGTSDVDPLAPTELQNLFRVGMLGSAALVPAPPIVGLGLVRVRTFFRRWDVDTVVADPVGVDPGLVLHYLTVAIGRPPVAVGGVDVWYHTRNA
jgi:hypothetical protein